MCMRTPFPTATYEAGALQDVCRAPASLHRARSTTPHSSLTATPSSPADRARRRATLRRRPIAEV
eukprot:12150561-Alexandrium_andersonii.AAC.1